jgi:hypothetical protein
MSDLYDGEVAASDFAFAALIDGLRARGLYDETLIVVTADHGEELHEHGGWEHGETLYGEVLDVPLLLRLPGGPRGVRVSEPVQQIDLLPTLLDALAIPWREDEAPTGGGAGSGRSLLPFFDRGRVATTIRRQANNPWSHWSTSKARDGSRCAAATGDSSAARRLTGSSRSSTDRATILRRRGIWRRASPRSWRAWVPSSIVPPAAPQSPCRRPKRQLLIARRSESCERWAISDRHSGWREWVVFR